MRHEQSSHVTASTANQSNANRRYLRSRANRLSSQRPIQPVCWNLLSNSGPVGHLVGFRGQISPVAMSDVRLRALPGTRASWLVQPPFHGGNWGSNPHGDATDLKDVLKNRRGETATHFTILSRIAMFAWSERLLGQIRRRQPNTHRNCTRLQSTQEDWMDTSDVPQVSRKTIQAGWISCWGTFRAKLR